MSFHCIVWYCMVLYCIHFFCTVSHCHVPLLQHAGELPRSASSHLILTSNKCLIWLINVLFLFKRYLYVKIYSHQTKSMYLLFALHTQRNRIDCAFCVCTEFHFLFFVASMAPCLFRGFCTFSFVFAAAAHDHNLTVQFWWKPEVQLMSCIMILCHPMEPEKKTH